MFANGWLIDGDWAAGDDGSVEVDDRLVELRVLGTDEADPVRRNAGPELDVELAVVTGEVDPSETVTGPRSHPEIDHDLHVFGPQTPAAFARLSPTERASVETEAESLPLPGVEQRTVVRWEG